MLDDAGRLGRPGLGVHAHAEFGIPVIGVAKSMFRFATHAVEMRRGTARKPWYVSAAGIAADRAAELARGMAGPYRLPDVPRRVDTRTRQPAG